MYTLQLVIVLCGLFAAFSHPQINVKKSDSCEDHPAPQSYHIHVLFWQNNVNSTKAAILLQDNFLTKFGLTRENNTCAFEPGDDPADGSLCVFTTDYVPAGPFLTAQTAIYVPIADYERTVSWTVQRRSILDVFVHPNSGCTVDDHLHSGVWSGQRWEVDPSIFFD